MNEVLENVKKENVQGENTRAENLLKDNLLRANKMPYITTACDLLKEDEDEYDCLWDPFISREEIVCLSGGSDMGKSSLLRQFAIAIVKKENSFLDHPLNVKHGSVIYVSLEDGRRGTKKALKKQLEDVEPEDFGRLRLIFSPDNIEKRLEEQLKLAPADVVIIDAFTNSFKGSINDIISVKSYLEKFKAICEKNNCVVIFLHHNGKRTEINGASKNNIIGSTGFEGTMRTCLELRKGDNNKRYLWITKGNYIPDNLKKEGLELSFDDKQEFKYTGKTVLNTSGPKMKFSVEEKKAILADAIKCQKEGSSLDDIKSKLKPKYSTLPGKTTLSTWLKDNKPKDAGESDAIAA